MPLRQETLYGIYGAWRIARFDTAALGYFNLTIDGFWRSFFAAAIVLPFYVVFALLNMGGGDGAEAAPWGPGYALAKAITYAVGWAAFPLAMIPLSRLLNVADRYVTYVIAWNWSSVVQMAVLFPLAVINATGLIPQSPMAVLITLAYACVLVYACMVARVGLGCQTITAVGVVVIDLLLSIFIDNVGEAIF